MIILSEWNVYMYRIFHQVPYSLLIEIIVSIFIVLVYTVKDD